MVALLPEEGPECAKACDGLQPEEALKFDGLFLVMGAVVPLTRAPSVGTDG